MDPIRVRRTGDRDANVQAAMQAFASVLEAKVAELRESADHVPGTDRPSGTRWVRLREME